MRLIMGDKLLPIVYHHQYHLLPPRRQGNRSHFTINSTKNLLYRRKNSVWDAYSRGEKSGHGGGWESSG